MMSLRWSPLIPLLPSTTLTYLAGTPGNWISAGIRLAVPVEQGTDAAERFDGSRVFVSLSRGRARGERDMNEIFDWPERVRERGRNWDVAGEKGKVARHHPTFPFVPRWLYVCQSVPFTRLLACPNILRGSGP